MSERVPWETTMLPDAATDTALDGSRIRPLLATGKASVVHCTLAAGQTAFATRNVGIDEIWYFLGGQGELWREGRAEPVAVSPGSCATIPAGIGFQFRATGADPLTFLCVTIPPWKPGRNEPAEGPWPARSP